MSSSIVSSKTCTKRCANGVLHPNRLILIKIVVQTVTVILDLAVTHCQSVDRILCVLLQFLKVGAVCLAVLQLDPGLVQLYNFSFRGVNPDF